MAKPEINCLLKRDTECPLTCSSHQQAKRVARQTGGSFDPGEFRKIVFLADKKAPTTIVDIAAVLSGCAAEQKPPTKQPSE